METINIEKLTEINEIMDSNLSRNSKINKLLETCSDELLVKLFYNINGFDENEKEIIKKLNDYLSFYRLYRISINELVNRLKKINSIYEMIISSNNDYQIADILIKSFKDSETLRKSYTEIRKHINDPCVQIAKDALDNFELIYNTYLEYEQEGKLERAKYYISFEQYFKNYNYAKFVIESYIEDEDSYKMKAFLYKFEIDKNTFNFCVHVIEECNPDLYEKYSEKVKANSHKNCMSNVQTIKGLAERIKSGLNNDGTPFTIFDFIKKVPFKSDDEFPSKINRFMNKIIYINMSEHSEIMNYIRKNKINSYTLSGINIDMLAEERQTINGVPILKSDIELIVGFLKISKIPVNKKTYEEALKLYVAGNIDKKLVQEQMKVLEVKKPSPILSLKKESKAA